jgi:hypothetical protein
MDGWSGIFTPRPKLLFFIDKIFLRRFLRARQHNIPRAKEMFLAHLRWRKEFGTDTILEDFHFEVRVCLGLPGGWVMSHACHWSSDHAGMPDALH